MTVNSGPIDDIYTCKWYLRAYVQLFRAIIHQNYSAVVVRLTSFDRAYWLRAQVFSYWRSNGAVTARCWAGYFRHRDSVFPALARFAPRTTLNTSRRHAWMTSRRSIRVHTQLCKSVRQYLVTCKISRYCLAGLLGGIIAATQSCSLYRSYRRRRIVYDQIWPANYERPCFSILKEPAICSEIQCQNNRVGNVTEHSPYAAKLRCRNCLLVKYAVTAVGVVEQYILSFEVSDFHHVLAHGTSIPDNLEYVLNEEELLLK